MYKNYLIIYFYKNDYIIMNLTYKWILNMIVPLIQNLPDLLN